MIAIRAVYSFRISWARAVLRSSARSMDDLASSSAATMLQTLQSRHAAELVFTRCGTLMLCLNPHAPLPHLFSREELQRHLHALGRQLPPHIFELGACSDAWHIIIIIMRQSHSRPARAQLTAIIVYAGFSQIQCKSLSVSARVCLPHQQVRAHWRPFPARASVSASRSSVRRALARASSHAASFSSSHTAPPPVQRSRSPCCAAAHSSTSLARFTPRRPAHHRPELCTVASTPTVATPPPHFAGRAYSTTVQTVVLGPLESMRSCCADPACCRQSRALPRHRRRRRRRRRRRAPSAGRPAAEQEGPPLPTVAAALEGWQQVSPVAEVAL